MSVVLPLRSPPVAERAEETFVIVGGGQAGVQAASTLRERGFSGRLLILSEEERLPYMRPPLSKKFLSGEQSEDRLYFRPASYFDLNGIEIQTGVKVLGIDRATSALRLASGATVRYDRLLLATGTRARALPVPGASDPRIHYLRTLDDAIQLRRALRPGSHLAVVGAGYLGLEVASTAMAAGLRVTLLESDSRVLGRVTTPSLSDFVEGIHRARGVDLRCDTEVIGFSGVDRLRLTLAGGTSIDADAAVIGIGAVPNDGLAHQAGLTCDDGIVVDEHGRTSDPHIFAAGDCTRHVNPLFARRLRLESVQNAIDQATVAATCMMGGHLSYCRVPWFWSHQYGFKLQSAGLLDGYDQVIERGDRKTGRFALLYFKAGELIAVDAVNMPGEYAATRRAIAVRGELSLDPVPQPSGRPRAAPTAADSVRSSILEKSAIAEHSGVR